MIRLTALTAPAYMSMTAVSTEQDLQRAGCVLGCSRDLEVVRLEQAD
jgi:hypothetical protein